MKAISEQFKESEEKIIKETSDYREMFGEDSRTEVFMRELNKNTFLSICDGEMARWHKREVTVMDSIKEKPEEKKQLQEPLLIAINEVYHWQKERDIISKSE